MLVDPEASKFLKLAIASRYSKIASEEWRNLRFDQDLEWSALASYSDTVGLAPLLYDTLRKSPEFPTPDETERFLKERYHDAATFNLFALHELSSLLNSVAPFKVPVVTLKGASLLHTVYENFALRPMVDLDLLILFADLERLLSMLADFGYVMEKPSPFPNYEGLFWNELLLENVGASKMHIELHWNLVDNPFYARQLPTETLISRSRILQVDAGELLILPPDYQILHLCIHNTYHHQNLLDRSLVDIAYVAGYYRDDLDWDRLTNTAIDCDMTYAVSTNLTLAANEWFAPIPPEILRHLARTGISTRERFFVFSQRSEFLKLGRTLVAVPGLRAKLSFVFGQLFPDKEYLTWRYGRKHSNNLLKLYIKRYISGIVGLVREVIGRPS